MKVEFTNPNIIVSTSRKVQFGADKKPVQVQTPNKIQDAEATYSKAVAIGAIGVLAGLGVAILHKEKIADFISNVRKHFSEPKAIIKPLKVSNSHGGPTIDITKGKTAIADAWNSYIKEIDKRVNEAAHENKKTKYINLFNLNADKLDRFEELANEVSTNRARVASAR